MFDHPYFIFLQRKVAKNFLRLSPAWQLRLLVGIKLVHSFLIKPILGLILTAHSMSKALFNFLTPTQNFIFLIIKKCLATVFIFLCLGLSGSVMLSLINYHFIPSTSFLMSEKAAALCANDILCPIMDSEKKSLQQFSWKANSSSSTTWFYFPYNSMSVSDKSVRSSLIPRLSDPNNIAILKWSDLHHLRQDIVLSPPHSEKPYWGWPSYFYFGHHALFNRPSTDQILLARGIFTDNGFHELSTFSGLADMFFISSIVMTCCCGIALSLFIIFDEFFIKLRSQWRQSLCDHTQAAHQEHAELLAKLEVLAISDALHTTKSTHSTLIDPNFIAGDPPPVRKQRL